MSSVNLPTMEKVENALRLLSMAIDIADKLVGALQRWGVLKDTKSADELGAKALYAEDCGIVEEKYNDFVEYLHAVDEINLPAEQHGAYLLEQQKEAGAKLLLGGLRTEMGEQAEAFVCETVNNADFYQADGRVENYAEAVKNGEVSVEDIRAYFDNILDELQTVKATDSALKTLEEKSGASPEEAVHMLESEMERRGGL